MRDRRLPINLLLGASVSAMALALLLPVIALVSTRVAAKAALANLHQLSRGFAMYAEEADQRFPMGDSCQPGSSLNPALDAPHTAGCGARSFDRVNADHWQKWVKPYVPSSSSFENPLRDRDALSWEANGVLANGLILDVGLFGLVLPDPGSQGARYNSWHNGTLPGIVNPDGALLIIDLPSFRATLPILARTGDRTAYPLAVREFYRYMINDGTLSDCMGGRLGKRVDLRKAPMAGLNRVAVGGGARFLPAERFLESTPPLAEWGVTAGLGRANTQCAPLSPSSPPALAAANLTPPKGYPLWDMQ
jgi:hypothetical protein